MHQRIVLFALMLAAAMPGAAATTGHDGAVLVTGASSGIGRKITELLAADGHFVFAGARKADDIDALSGIENVRGIRLDVTLQGDIDAAVDLVASSGRKLHAVVNNAGVNSMGPLVEIDESELDFLFDVNVYGPYRVTRAFAPMIIESKGRIVNVSSISGTLSGPLYGIYSMSKHALEAYTDSLAREMSMLGVKVIGIEPGNYKTRIYHNRCDRLLARGFDPSASLWQDAVSRMVRICKERPKDTDPEPDQVADAVRHALYDDTPKEHYLVVPEQWQAEITIRKAIEELVRLNEKHDFSYSRAELIDLLDEALAGETP